MLKNGLIRKLQLISKLMASQTGQQIITPNITRSEDNQTMKFGQLIKYSIKNISLEKLYTKLYREASPRPFYKKPKLSISLDPQSEML